MKDLGVFREWSEGEGLFVAHEADEGEQLPQILNQAEVEVLELLIVASVHEENDELDQRKDENQPENDPGDDRKAQSVKESDRWKRRARFGRGWRSASRRNFGHRRRS